MNLKQHQMRAAALMTWISASASSRASKQQQRRREQLLQTMHWQDSACCVALDAFTGTCFGCTAHAMSHYRILSL
jgi:hypothetical protein